MAISAGAQTSSISLDGSLPNGRTDVLTGPSTGPDYTIGEDLGWRAGPNLFHSFQDFSIGVNESATFTENPGMPALAHVIARVTGGSPSVIDGALRSEIAGADFYFLNPAGVLFGGTASIDVPASFTVSTAHRLHFEGTNAFLDLLDANQPALRVEPPSAFGFLETGPRSLIEFGNADVNFPVSYALSDENAFTLVGGDVTVRNAVTLNAPQGRVQLAAAGARTTEVPLDVADADADEMGGVVSVLNRSALLALGDAGRGTVVIRGGELVLGSAAVVRASGTTGAEGSAIDLATSGSITISDAGTLVRSEATRASSGPIRMVASDVEIAESAIVTSLVRAADPTVRSGGVVIEANTIGLSDGAVVSTVTQREGLGGDVRLDGAPGAGSRIDLLNGSAIESLTTTDGAGGDISLTAATVLLSDSDVNARSTADGAAGSIAIEGADIRLIGQSQVDTLVSASPVVGSAGGDVFLGSRDSRTGSVRIGGGGAVATQTSGPNPGGSIEMESGRIRLEGDASGPALVESSTLGEGDGGAIRISANRLELTGDGNGAAGQVAAVVTDTATGTGGDIGLEVGDLQLENGSQISSTTFGAGDGGSIEIAARRTVGIEGSVLVNGVPTPSGLFSASRASGDAGNIAVDAANLFVENGGEISSRSFDSGRAGDVRLQVQQLVRVAGKGLRGSIITARGTNLPGGAGGVDIDAGRVEVLDGAIIDVSTSGTAPGGALTIDAREVLVAGRSDDGQAASLGAQADSIGDAGGIAITAGRVEIGEGGQVSALSRGLGGNPGDIAITAGDLLIGGTVTAEAANSRGGNIALVAANTAELRGGRVSARSTGSGDAGSIAIRARRFVSVGGRVDTDAQAFGGNIDLIASELVHLVDSELTAISRGGANAQNLAGGNIFIDPPAVVISNTTITANGLGNANGGNIFIVGNPLLVSGDSTITASSQFGTQGQVVVQSPNSEITGELVSLPSDFLDASALLAEACLARDEVTGTFSVRAVPTLPPPPDAPFAPDAASAGQQCETP